MADTHPSASRCTTQDVEEARARAPFAKLGSTEETHRVGIAFDRLASVAKRPRWNGHRPPSGDEGLGNKARGPSRTERHQCAKVEFRPPLEERRARNECYDIWI